MGSMYRSEEMALFQLFLHSDVAYECISELGELKLVQFLDLNGDISPHQRKFVNEVRRCSDIERKLRYLEAEIDKAGISRIRAIKTLEAPQPCDIFELETTIANAEHELRDVNNTIEILKRNMLELIELKYILHETQQFFEEGGENSSTESMSRDLLKDNNNAQQMDVHLGCVTGVISRERFPAFERMLWRAYRGNVFLRQAEIITPLEDPSSGNILYKSVFMILFQEQLRTRVLKICDGFGATLYTCPDSQNERREMAMTVLTRIQDLDVVLAKSRDQRITLLMVVAKYVQQWYVKIIKMKAIYLTFNMFNLDVTQKCLIGECWLPVRDIENVHMALQRGMIRSDSSVPPIMNRIETPEVPPTFVKTNKFTKGFQILIDAYGVANYREINPALYTIITFPFLFAVMFGDLGHGTIMFLFASWMVVMEKKLTSKHIENEIWKIFFGGRYVILLMGMFSMYTGFIYNDLFSKSINIFGSHWNVSLPVKDMMEEKDIKLDPKYSYVNTPYPIGLDPVWQVSQNKIRFLNAYKMKLSVIIGVVHMLFGVSLSVLNYIYFKRKADIIVLFLPEAIFLLCIFCYLIFLIFLKWVTYSASNPVETSPGCAPSILVTFINMMLFAPSVANDPCSPWMYTGQEYIQNLLVIAAVVCIPWLLFAKPYLTLRDQKKFDNHHKNAEMKTAIPETKHVDKAELMIHQGIHTIEYVLGSVSHTASYLRLWALSLAHAQLAEVLWMMVMRPGLTQDSYLGGLALFLLFPCWAVLTISVLVLMEGLSAFLHTLRLHWVEFQSKFYAGAGQSFMPFSFKAILQQASEVGYDKVR